jgi:hypothetical protein
MSPSNEHFRITVNWGQLCGNVHPGSYVTQQVQLRSTIHGEAADKWTLKITTKLTCNNPGYLLPCEPRGNSTGHYTCHDGNKNCLPRWYGRKCLQTCVKGNWSSRKHQMLSDTTSPTNSTIHGEAAIIIPRLETLQPRSIISHKRIIKIRTKLTCNNPGCLLLHVHILLL